MDGCHGLDYTPICHVKKVTNLRELTKYITKPSDYLIRGPDGWEADGPSCRRSTRRSTAQAGGLVGAVQRHPARPRAHEAP